MTDYPPRDDRLRHLIAQEINPHVPSWKLAFFIADGILTSRAVRGELKRVAEVHAAGEHCGDRNCEHCWNATMTGAPAVPAVPVSSPPPDQTAEPVCKFEEGCHRVVACDPGCAVAAAELHHRLTAALPPLADRAAVLREAAEHLLTKLYGAVYNDAGQKAADGVNRAVRELLDLADAAELRRLAAEAQQPDDAERRVYAWAQTIDTADGGNTICIPGVHLSGGGSEETAVIVSRKDVPVLAAMLAEAQQPDTETRRPVHAVPLPGSNGISSCCGRPPCEFVGERVTRNPEEVTCTPDAPPVHKGGNADDCPACIAGGLDTIGPPYECPGPERP